MPNKQAYFNRLLQICGDDNEKKKEFIKEAYKVALDTRKFEIDMYWKRAGYFWAFIVAIFVAYFAAKKDIYLSTALALLGFLFSLGWNMVARGSKLWQENWEMHIRYLEEEIHGPLFKTFGLHNTHFWKLNKEFPFSVSKVNQVLSLYTCIFWLFVFFYTLCKFLPKSVIDYFYNAYGECIIIEDFGIITMFFLLLVYGVYSLSKKSLSFQMNLSNSNQNFEEDFKFTKRKIQSSIIKTVKKKKTHKK